MDVKLTDQPSSRSNVVPGILIENITEPTASVMDEANM
jgi:hypothetical protein